MHIVIIKLFYYYLKKVGIIRLKLFKEDTISQEIEITMKQEFS